MKRSVKAAAAILTAVSMVTGLTACGSSGSASGTPAAQSEPKSDTSQNPASGGSEYTGILPDQPRPYLFGEPFPA